MTTNALIFLIGLFSITSEDWENTLLGVKSGQQYVAELDNKTDDKTYCYKRLSHLEEHTKSSIMKGNQLTHNFDLLQ